MKFAVNINNVTERTAKRADIWILDVPNRKTLEEVYEKYNIEKIIEKIEATKIELIINNVRYEDLTTILKNNSNKVFFAAASVRDMELLIEEEIPNVFCALPVTNEVTFDYFANTLKVPKIIVGGQLGFSLKYLDKKNTEIMINPAYIYGEKGDLKSFFIRPEDIDLYEEIVDILFFIPKNIKYEEVLFDVYKKRKVWYGDLKDIVINLKSPFYNQYLFNDDKINFGEMRLTCRKKCINCRYCDNILVLQDLIKSKEKELKGGVKNNG